MVLHVTALLITLGWGGGEGAKAGLEFEILRPAEGRGKTCLQVPVHKSVQCALVHT